MRELTKVTASNLERLMLCAGSLRFEDVIKLPQSDDAKDGDLFEELLISMYYGKPQERSKSGEIFTKEMHIHANRMLPHIPANSVSQFVCNWVTQHTGVQMSNRLDFYSIDEATNTLYITDVKFGYGIVEVEKNWQMIDYGIGVVINLKRAFSKIVFRIIQPRSHHEDGPVRDWTITYKELLAFKDQIEARILECKNGNTELVTGNHCRFCKAGDSFVCPAKNKAFNNAVSVVMTEIKQDYLTEQDISELLDLYEKVKNIFKIQEKSLGELAKHRIRSNKLIPNYTTVDSYGHTKWNPEATAEAIEAVTGCSAKVVETMSPSEFQNTYNLPEMLIKGLTHRPYNGTNLKRKNAGEIADKVFNTKKEGT